jgi:hypothetical protein
VTNGTDPRHGTVTGYNRIPCREDCCRAAYLRWRKQRNHEANHGRRRIIDATGSRRRIEALQTLGWGYEQLAAAGPLSERSLWNAANYATIGIEKAQRIAELYDRLSMTPGPSKRARMRAQRKLFAPPLAWSEGSIDDPNAEPMGARYNEHRSLAEVHGGVDPVVVARAMNGEKVRAALAEKRLITRRWRRAGRPLNELDRIQGWNSRRYMEGAA